MLNLAIWVVLGALAVAVVARLKTQSGREQRARESRVHHEPIIDQIDVIDDTDRYYQPAESTDAPIEWLAHQYKRDPVIWDSQDDGFYDNPANREFSIRVRRKLRASYFDREGQETLRQIDTLRLGETTAGVPQILAYCHTCMRNLTFRPASMQDCVDLDTGLKITDVVAYLTQEYAASAQASCDRAFADYQDIFRTLLYLDKKSMGTDLSVVDAMTEACRQVADDERISAGMVREALRALPPMSREQFEISVSRFTQMRMPIDLAHTADRIIDAMRRPGADAYEARAYIEMRERLPVPL